MAVDASGSRRGHGLAELAEQRLHEPDGRLPAAHHAPPVGGNGERLAHEPAVDMSESPVGGDGKATAETPRRGRPRSEKARHAILESAAELLLLRGLDAVSMDAVAERAGVSKATIFRWWPSKEMLALDALLGWAAASAPPRDTGSLRGDVLALIRPWVREIRRRPFGRVIAAFVNEAQSDPRFAEAYRTHFVEPRRDGMRAVFARARERGEVRTDLDVEVALDLIYGAVYHRLLHGHAKLTDRFVGDLVELALNGIAAR